MSTWLHERPLTGELAFHLYDRFVHPEFIDSLACQRFEKEGYLLDVHLTTAGHAIRWRFGKIAITEVLAEQDSPLPENGQLFTHRIAGERSETFQIEEKISYQTCFQVERLSPTLFFRVQDELTADSDKATVFHSLRPKDRLGLSPISSIELQCRPGSLIAHSYHTFPDEFAIVKTQTLIDFV